MNVFMNILDFAMVIGMDFDLRQLYRRLLVYVI